MIYAWSNHTAFGGSTILIDAVIRHLNKAGVPAQFHGTQEWFTRLSPYNRVEPLPRLTADDVLLGHYYPLKRRPPIRKSVLILHEDREFQLRRKNISGYDIIVFSSENHERKVRTRQGYNGPGVMIPNIVEVDFSWKPPAVPTAGIIGTICARKAQHISIQRAREAGFKHIRLYGNREPAYYNEFVRPLIGGGVRFCGLSENKEEMYNSISEVFHYSTEEQACVVLGECKKLGIPFHCSKAVEDWDLYPTDHIVTLWRDLLE